MHKITGEELSTEIGEVAVIKATGFRKRRGERGLEKFHVGGKLGAALRAAWDKHRRREGTQKLGAAPSGAKAGPRMPCVGSREQVLGGAEGRVGVGEGGF